MTHGQLIAMSAFWASSNFLWGALLVVVVAHQVGTMAPGHKAEVVGLIFSLGALPALLVPLVVGPMSDRCTSRWGRRRPYMFVGTAITVVAMAALYVAGALSLLWLYVLAYLIIQVGNNIATAAYSGFIPDMVPIEQRGIASGYMAVMSQSGTLLGVVSSGFFITAKSFLLCYLVLVGVLVLGLLITFLWVHEPQHIWDKQRSHWKVHLRSLWIDPRKYPDFAWVWLTRALVMLGFYSVLPFLQYFLQDVIGDPHPAKTSASLSGLVLIAAMISGYVGGHLSDRWGRKPVVYFANGFMAFTCLALAFCRTLESTLFVGVLFGAGYGAYISVDWALGTDVLPNKKEAAKDMAVWHIAMTLPQAIAALPAGLLIASFGVRSADVTRGNWTGALGLAEAPESLTHLHYTVQGYIALFIAASLCLAMGAILLRKVRGAR